MVISVIENVYDLCIWWIALSTKSLQGTIENASVVNKSGVAAKNGAPFITNQDNKKISIGIYDFPAIVSGVISYFF